MADGALPPACEARRTFLVTAHDEYDILLRVLAPFAVQGVRIVAAELAEREGQVAIRIEVMDMAMARAQLVCERLRAMPAVRGVGLGWRSEALAA